MTDKWVRDTGLIFALVSLFFAWRGSLLALAIAAALIFAVLFVPIVLRPLAYLWQKLAEVLGFFVNKIFFGIVFFLIVTPVGLLRRLFTKDPLSLAFKNTKESALIEREVVFTKEHITHPF